MVSAEAFGLEDELVTDETATEVVRLKGDVVCGLPLSFAVVGSLLSERGLAPELEV